MNLELLILGGYGQFVWPAFIITFVSCLMLYVKTKKKLRKNEKMYLKEYNQLDIAETKEFEKEEIKKEVLSGKTI